MTSAVNLLQRSGPIPPDPGPTGWNAILPERASTPPLQGEQQADFVVIGAGFAGLSAARRLLQLQPNARVMVLEARNVAEGPAGRNSGFMIDLPHDLASDDYAGTSAENDRRQTALNRGAIHFALDAAQEYGMPQEAVNPCGKINAAASSKGLQHNQEYAHHLDALGEDYRLLDASEMQTLTGIDYYQGGLWTPGTAMLQPALYIRSLADGLQQAGMILHEQSAARQLENTPRGWQVTTAQGSVTAPKIILAVNGLLQQFGFYPGQLMHVFTYASMTRELTPKEEQQLGGEAEWGFTPADPMGSTVRRISGRGGHRIVVRNRFTYDPKITVSKRRMTDVARNHRQSFNARFPMLRHVDMEYCWGGRLCLSLNGVSVVGKLSDNLYAACCQNGLGAAKGTVAGIIAAEQAVESTQTLLPDYQAETAPKRLWPEPLMWLGANGYMRWKEWRAGLEF